jgi:hypothetical protein
MTGEHQPKTSEAVKAKFYSAHPHLWNKNAPVVTVEEEIPAEVIVEDQPLEAGSWEAPIVEESIPDAPLIDRRTTPKKRIARHKTRRSAVSIAVSEEEERILRTYASGLDKSFSEWSRAVLFRAMGRKVPSRRERGDRKKSQKKGAQD